MKEIKTKKYKGSFLLRLAVMCFAAFLIFTLFSQRIAIGDKKNQLETLQDDLKVQQIINAELQYSLDSEVNIADYAEKAARQEFGYAKPQEKIFINVGGNN